LREGGLGREIESVPEGGNKVTVPILADKRAGETVFKAQILCNTGSDFGEVERAVGG
ncbi:hypothetical protein BG011_002873, partial [Mortierella polycephala]